MITELSKMLDFSTKMHDFQKWCGFREPLILHNENKDHLQHLEKVLNITGYQHFKVTELNFLKSRMMYLVTKCPKFPYPCIYFSVPDDTCK